MLTIAKMHGESVAYYESTVATSDDKISSPDDYYSEDGTQPATAWIQARTQAQATTVATALGIKNGAQVKGADVGQWFNHALAPSGHKLGRAPKSSGVPGFDLTFWVLLQSWARVEKPNLKTLVVLAPGCLSCLEYPADDHRVWVRVPVGKHRALAFPQ